MDFYRSTNYGRPEPGYRMVGYAERQESYMAKSEQVVEFRHGNPGLITNFKHSPPRRDFYKDHRVEDDHHRKPTSFLVPWGSPRGSPKKAGDFSPPEFRGDGFHDRKHKPIRRDEYGKFDNPKSNDDRESDESDDDDHDYVCNDGVCVRGGDQKPKYHHQDDYEKKMGNGYVSPPYTTTHKPMKNTYYDQTTLNDDNKNNEKNNRNGYYAPPSNHTIPLIKTQPRKETYYDQPPSPGHNYEKNKGNGYAPHETTQPRKDTYYETPYIGNNYEKNKGNGYVPHETTQPRKETYYETSNNNSPRFSGPPPIKTRRDVEFSNENSPLAHQRNSPFAHQKPQYNSPIKDESSYKPTIDSMEARRRYGGVSVPSPAGVEKHTGIIDSKEAARKYKGVVVPY